MLFQEYIAEESNEAAEIKRDIPVMVVIGNPPYSISSANKSKWISEQIQEYKKDLNEKKLNLDDDYIKFIRFSQYRIDKTGHGILAFITNNSYISGLVHRQMRKSLSQSFDCINILDAHGSVLMKEKSPDGSKDENVFDIQQGVSITFNTKVESTKNKDAVIEFYDLYGSRESKYKYLEKYNVKTTTWTSLKPEVNFLFFCPKDFSLRQEYELYYSLTNMFIQYNLGCKTERDQINIQYDKASLENIISDFRVLTEMEIRKKYSLDKDSRDWKIEGAKKDVLSVYETEIGSYIHQILYRPFDFRYIFYTGKTRGIVGTPAHKINKHFLSKNIGLIFERRPPNFDCYFLTDKVTDIHSLGTAFCSAYVAPLYLYSDSSFSEKEEQSKISNFSKEFLTIITDKLSYTPTPEAIFYYIYAIFHSPTYRTRYAEFLKIDFPRVPLTSDDQLFRKLGEYGEELVALHLMKSPKLDQHLTQIIDKGGEFVVDAGHPKYTDGEVIINKKGDRFTGVPKSVWEFYVGGYQVCHKWLKDRKGRQLSPEDLNHYQKIIVALSETMQIMNAIDAAIPSFPIE